MTHSPWFLILDRVSLPTAAPYHLELIKQIRQNYRLLPVIPGKRLDHQLPLLQFNSKKLF